MDIQEIVEEYLKAHNYDGLYCEGVCACKLDGLMPCGEPGNCKVGYYVEGCTCEVGCKFHIVPEKKSQTCLSPWERIWAKTTKTFSCWEWRGATTPEGYGLIRIDGKLIGVHRWVYIQCFGEIPKDKEIDHLCRNRCCLRPSHLEAVTHSVNVKRGISWQHFVASAARITHCPQGHPYDDTNTYIDKNNTRHCKTCTKHRAKEYQRRRRRQLGIQTWAERYPQAAIAKDKENQP